MVRAFETRPVAPDVLDELLDLARRAPSAGNTQPWELLVLDGADVARYWDMTLGERRNGFRWQGLLRAPVLVVPYVRPTAYAERYAEADKASTGLGDDVSAWPVPYWWIDGGALVENLLLAATAAGLGSCFFGQFQHEAGGAGRVRCARRPALPRHGRHRPSGAGRTRRERRPTPT